MRSLFGYDSDGQIAQTIELKPQYAKNSEQVAKTVAMPNLLSQTMNRKTA